MFFIILTNIYHSDVFLSSLLLGDKSRSKDEGEKFMDKMADVLGRVGHGVDKINIYLQLKMHFKTLCHLQLRGL